MTAEQKSKQASANSNAKRITWQREAIRCKTIMAEQHVALDKMGTEITRLCGRLCEVRTELADAQGECRQMEALLNEWRDLAQSLQNEIINMRARAKLDAAKQAELPY